jgi:hypothetical protein
MLKKLDIHMQNKFNQKQTFHLSQVNSECIINLNVKWNAVRHLEENLGDLSCGEETVPKTTKFWPMK